MALSILQRTERIIDSQTTVTVLTVVCAGVGLIALNGHFMTVGNISLMIAWALIAFRLRDQPLIVFFAGSGLAGSLLLFLAYYLRPPNVPLNFGILRPNAELVFSPGGPAPPHLEVGDSGMFFDKNDRFGRAMFPFLERDQFKVEIIDGRYKISTDLKDEDGKMIAQIIRNEWRVTPQAWDRNYNENTLEVKDAHGEIILQVHVLPDRMQIQGVWSTPGFFWKRVCIFAEHIVDIDMRHGQTRITVQPTVAKLESGEVSPLQPWFLYSSDHHFGELTDIGQKLK